jgi:hypothetical protein
MTKLIQVMPDQIDPNPTSWNRCGPDCGCKDPNKPRAEECTCRSLKCGTSSRNIAQRRRYALRVTESLTGPMVADSIVCPLTGILTPVRFCEVDRVEPSLGYVPGNVVLTSYVGNNERGKLQEHHGDIAGFPRYVSDVFEASKGIAMPNPYAAWKVRHEIAVDPDVKKKVFPSPTMANVLSGPYGIA